MSDALAAWESVAGGWEKQRGRVFSYTRYAAILNEGMDPPKKKP